MASKYQLISALYDEMTEELIESKDTWMDFLRSAGYNFRLRFDEQVLVYAQRPDATAVLGIEGWNGSFNRWVNKGARGIAVFDNTAGTQKLRYYFDVTDTHAGRYAKEVPVWEARTEHYDEITETLESTFGELKSKGDLRIAVLSAAENGSEDNIDEYLDTLRDIKDAGGLVDIDGDDLKVIFRETVSDSVNYMMARRLGIEPLMDEDSFRWLLKFDTKDTLNILGFAVSDISQMGLSEIAKTVRSLDSRDRTFDRKENNRYNDEKQDGRDDDEHNIHGEGRLPYTGSGTARGEGSDSRDMGDEKKEIPSGKQEGDVLQSVDFMHSERAPDADRSSGAGDDGGPYGKDDEGAGHNREVKGRGHDELGEGDEQHKELSGGDSAEGPDLQLEYFDRETEDRSLPFFNSNKLTDAVHSLLSFEELTDIENFYEEHTDEAERIDYLKTIFAPERSNEIYGTKTYSNVLFMCEGKTDAPESAAYYDWGVIESHLAGMVLVGELYRDLSNSEFEFTQEIIDEALTSGSGFENGKFRIYEQIRKSLSTKENADFLKNEYGWGGRSDISPGTDVGEDHNAKGIKLYRGYMPESPKILIKWTEAAKRIEELVKADRYLNPKEMEKYPSWLEERDRKIAEREKVREASESIDIDDLALRIRNFAEDTDPYGFRDNFSEDVTEAEIVESYKELLKSRSSRKEIADYIDQFTKEEADTDIRDAAVSLLKDLDKEMTEYEFSISDKVYIGASGYEIIAIDDEKVKLFDSSCPLVNKEMPMDEFKRKVKESFSNEHLKKQVEVEEVTEKTPSAEDPVKEEAPPLEPKWEAEVLPDEEEYNGEKINFRIDSGPRSYGGKKERFRDNIEAIRLLKRLEEERRYADHDEQEILSRYEGWGGISEAFDPENSSWRSEYEILKDLLSEDEYRSARESTLTSFYTPPQVITAIYDAFEGMGFKNGNILEPACGTGNFMGCMPDSMKECRFYGVEFDEISGSIAKQLYPENRIQIGGFEDADLHDSFFDAAIGNVPFGNFKVSDRRYDRKNWLIHDYFFGKTLDKVRPGGVIAYITSKGTMDKADTAVRRYISQRAELIGAIRLPDDTFTDNAGTRVTSDIIFLQKRDRIVDMDDDWVYLDRDENGILMNSYYTSHPEMIMGEMKMISGRFGEESACISQNGAVISEQLKEAVRNIRADIEDRAPIELDDEREGIPADPSVRNFSYTVADGEIYYRENSVMYTPKLSETAKKRVKGLINIRESVRSLIEYQLKDHPAEVIAKEQKRLNTEYDSFTKKYGLINSRANTAAFSDDSSFYLLSALEVLDENGKLVRKADIFSKQTIRPVHEITHCDTASEALGVSIGEKAGVDMAYMMELTGKSEDELYESLKGIIFLNPDHGVEHGARRYISGDEYLSGNVREKYRRALSIAEENPDYRVNAEFLEKVQPEDLDASEISVRLGATWLPVEVVSDFMFELFETPGYMRWNIKLNFSEYTGEWNIEGKNNDRGNINAYSTFGTGRINGYKILEETLNLKDVRIFDYNVDPDGKRTAVLNKKETAIAQSKQEAIKQAFQDWIWKDPDRRESLTKMYNERFNSIRTREYSGEHLTLTGMNSEIELREHQRNAVARILYGGNTLLAHVVGAGKTYTMAAAAMESRRLGLSTKAMFVVPNHLTEQWAAEFLQLYPSANILVATKKDFQKKNRKRFCSRIATGEFDAVIIGHTQFEKIPLSIERQKRSLEEQLNEITEGIAELKGQRGQKFSIKAMEKSRKQVMTRLNKLNDQSRKDDVITFEELGVDRLFIDESHYYKNLYLYTKMRNVGGIAQTEAQKSSDLFMKCRYLDELTGGKGTVFATGTPISNSMVELYTIQRYLQYDMLKKYNLTHFDAWASTFGETVSAIELAPEGSGYRAKTRFAKFYNLPELMTMFREVADIQTADMLKLPVPKANYHNVTVKPSGFQKTLIEELSDRAERVRNKMVDSRVDNMLKITNDGRKLALDQRLMNDLIPDDDGSKINACVENIYDIWKESSENRSAQLVFCDLSTPKKDGEAFSVYDDIRAKLIQKGIPKEEIEFIHDADTEAKKNVLFSKVRSGDTRILLGSTQKMGAGTNVQERLIALHDIDCPWV